MNKRLLTLMKPKPTMAISNQAAEDLKIHVPDVFPPSSVTHDRSLLLLYRRVRSTGKTLGQKIRQKSVQFFFTLQIAENGLAASIQTERILSERQFKNYSGDGLFDGALCKNLLHCLIFLFKLEHHDDILFLAARPLSPSHVILYGNH